MSDPITITMVHAAERPVAWIDLPGPTAKEVRVVCYFIDDEWMPQYATVREGDRRIAEKTSLPSCFALDLGVVAMLVALQETGVTTRQCEWFALCGNLATGVRMHPIMGDVPICERCANLVDSL